MLMVRCMADVFMYCSGTPAPSNQPGYLGRPGCKKDPANCGHQIGNSALSPAPVKAEEKKPAKTKK